MFPSKRCHRLWITLSFLLFLTTLYSILFTKQLKIIDVEKEFATNIRIGITDEMEPHSIEKHR